MKTGYTAGKAYRGKNVSPYVEIWQQPFWRWVIAEIYHWWEKHTDFFMVKVSRWHRNQFQADGDFDYVPLVNRRDIRCYHLSQIKRKTLTTVYITDKQYDVLTGKTEPEQVRHQTSGPIVFGLATEEE